jgi:hypothetical protein
MELLKQDIKVYDEKAAKLALEEAATVSVEAETFEKLRSELAALESRVRQCAGQAGVDRVLSLSSSLSVKFTVNGGQCSLCLKTNGHLH